MYSLRIVAGFSSAHNLRGYKGRCEELHGHNWKVEAVILSDKLDKLGMVADFKYLKSNLHKILEKLDHKYLNHLPCFRRLNPTSENIAKYIYDSFKRLVPYVASVTVWENETSAATYEPRPS